MTTIFDKNVVFLLQKAVFILLNAKIKMYSIHRFLISCSNGPFNIKTTVKKKRKKKRNSIKPK